MSLEGKVSVIELAQKRLPMPFPLSFSRAGKWDLLEYHGLIAVNQDRILQVQAQRTGEDHALQIPAFSDKVVQGIFMGDADDVLFDDGSFI